MKFAAFQKVPKLAKRNYPNGEHWVARDLFLCHLKSKEAYGRREKLNLT